VNDTTMARPLPSTGTDFLDGLTHVVVAGLGRSGRGAAALLAAVDVPFTVVDAHPDALSPEALAALPAGTQVVAQSEAAAVVAAADLLVVSPGIDLRHRPWCDAAAPRMGEMELAWRFVDSPLVAITGSNGKSTVTALTGALLAAAGCDARVCGNIGTPLSAAVADQRHETVFVVEVSSFQLETISGFAPDVAVLLNVTPDHQDRYAGHSDYVAAKERIFAAQAPGGRAVLGVDDAAAAAMAARLAARDKGPQVLPFSLTSPPAGDGAWLADGTLMIRWQGTDSPLLHQDELELPGPHNVANALAASLAAQAIGVPPAPATLAAFPPLAHRLETVARRDGIRFVNDSKATNVESARMALRAFAPGHVQIILGGRDKGSDFAALAGDLRERARAVYAMGEAGPAIAAALAPVLPASLPITTLPDLEAAVQAAGEAAADGDVILLSPACSSFDAYSDFTARGEHFRRLATAWRRESDHGA
jgi:UDP-N-acetylmuramoylalanine--D-glutamate ligase